MGEALTKQQMKELEQLFKIADLTNVSSLNRDWITSTNMCLIYICYEKFSKRTKKVACADGLAEFQMGN